MRSRKRLLKKSRLYLLIDRKVSCLPDPALIKKLPACGVDIVQLRDKSLSRKKLLKEALILGGVLGKTRTLFIVNDYLDIALISGSDGIHLGQLDASVKLARSILGKDKIIGVSCSNLKQALKAQREGADYLGWGPVFESPLKPGVKAVGLGGIRNLKGVNIPVFAIGNINLGNLSKVKACGIRRVAVARAILRAKNITETASIFSKELRK